jgi:putative acetyltransferase
MEFRQHTQDDSSAIEFLFASVFAKSEGEAAGKLISNLAKELITDTDEDDLYGFVVIDNCQIIGSIFFSRLTFKDSIKAFILSPVAVHNDYQGKGIGQELINHGLNALKDEGVNVVLTYGDPKFYHKVGFHHISHEKIRAPFKLSQPEGWLGQSLIGNSIENISGSCTCVKALNNPLYW